jgi:hypothetical protein
MPLESMKVTYRRVATIRVPGLRPARGAWLNRPVPSWSISPRTVTTRTPLGELDGGPAVSPLGMSLAVSSTAPGRAQAGQAHGVLPAGPGGCAHPYGRA